MMLSILSIELNAQSILKDSLMSVEIVDFKMHFNGTLHESGNVTPEERLIESGNLAEALTYNSPMYIHNYGPGILKTAKLDGNAAGYTPVLWNGISIQSATNGSADLNLLPASIFNNVSFRRGSSGMYGSGVIGGAIILDSKRESENDISLGLSSMENINMSTNLYYNEEGLDIRFSVNGLLHNNQYPYVLKESQYLKDKKSTIQHEAEMYGFNLSADVDYRISTNSLFKYAIWVQSYQRDIASNKVSKSSNATQFDDNKRMNLSYLYFGDNWKHKIQIGLFDDYLLYKSDVVKTSNSNVLSLFLLDELEYLIDNKNRFIVGMSYRSDRANASFYKEVKIRKDASIYAMYRRDWKVNYVFGNVRLNIQNWENTVLNGELGFHTTIDKSWQIEYRVARNIKFPNLNDLYWPSLGNPELKRELAHAIQFNINNNWNTSKFKFYMDFDLGFSAVKDKIVWSPFTSGLWKPSNIAGVDLYTASLFFKVDYSITKNSEIRSSWNLNYTYSKVTNSSNKDDIGKELTYTPKYKWTNVTSWRYKNYKVQLETVRMGSRYVLTDNNKSIDAYWVNNLGVETRFKYGNNNIIVGIGVDNLWNRNYEVVPTFAMPLRTYELNFKFKY